MSAQNPVFIPGPTNIPDRVLQAMMQPAVDIYSGPLAEFVLMGMLQHVKDLDLLRADKAGKTWRQGMNDTLERKTLCVVGTGSIGRAVADRARPFGMRAVGVKRSVRGDDAAWGSFDELYETKDLKEALGRADFVVLTLPGTPETERLLDGETIGAIKPGAYFCNVGRGKVVDEAALVEALRDGRLSGAALDVFEVEPLPEDSPLWEMENVVISAHTTDVVPGIINAAQADLFCENLRRYLAGLYATPHDVDALVERLDLGDLVLSKPLLEQAHVSSWLRPGGGPRRTFRLFARGDRAGFGKFSGLVPQIATTCSGGKPLKPTEE